MKGILLAGGSGTRLWPLTASVNKHLLPVYDKPMIFYPLATLMQAGVRDILLITTPADIAAFRNLLGDGSSLGLTLSYAKQEKPRGIAEAFLIGERFLGGQPCMLALGDNIFDGGDFETRVATACLRKDGATVFARQVSDPQRFGIATINENGKVTSLAEKPRNPESNWAVTGLYIYDSRVVSIARGLRPSARGELEITDVNRAYLGAGDLHVECLPPSVAWLDTGTPDSLWEASNYVREQQKERGMPIADLQLLAEKQGFSGLMRKAG